MCGARSSSSTESLDRLTETSVLKGVLSLESDHLQYSSGLRTSSRQDFNSIVFSYEHGGAFNPVFKLTLKDAFSASTN